MNYLEYTKLIEKQISLLTQKRQLQLALKICKELFFEYHTFSKRYHFGDPDLLLDGITLCEKSLTGSVVSSEIKELIPRIDSMIPDMDDYDSSELASYALNASASVCETLEFILDNDYVHIENVATYYTDTIDFKVQEGKALTSEEIDRHPLMIQAREFLLRETK